MPGEGDGKQEGEGKGAASDVQQQLADIQARMTVMEGENKTLKDAKVDLEQRLDEADKELLSDAYLDFKDKGGKSPAKGENKGVADDIDLDRASNREIVEFIERKYKGDVDAAVKDIRKELDLSKQQMGLVVAQVDVALTATRHNGGDGKPSWKDNQKAIFDIAKANPSWNAERCYNQFLLQSKADADDKAAADKERAEAEDKAATEKATGVPSSAAKGKRMDADTAGDIAYRKAFGSEK